MVAEGMSCASSRRHQSGFDDDGNNVSPSVHEGCDTDSDVSTEPGTDVRESLQTEAADGTPQLARQTLIIFDWDDTLLPTTWLCELGLLEKGAVISEEQEAKLQALAGLVAITLREAKRRGDVAIVTNAERGWVEHSCSMFVPSLEAELVDVRIISARTDHEKHGLYAPTTWKCLAFSKVVADLYSAPRKRIAFLSQRNIISLGDSEHEMEALKWVAADVECFAKCVKFVRRPCLEQLMDQHSLVAGCLSDVVDHDGNLDYEVGVEDG